jgi:hypothetical protein
MVYEYITWNLLTQEFENEFGTFKFKWKKSVSFMKEERHITRNSPHAPLPNKQFVY